MLSVSLAHQVGEFALSVRFETASGGATALFGPSGAGKSTILDAIAGLLRPGEGRIILDDRVLVDTHRRVFVPAERRRIGVVFQEGRLFPHLSVRENLLFGWRRCRGPKMPPRVDPPPQAISPPTVDSVIALLGLEALLRRAPSTLSGGERQRVALGRALLMQPRLLLLDEPLSALDVARRAEILPYLERLRDDAQVPILLVSHAVEEVARLADRVIVLDHGRVQAQGAVQDVFSRLDLAPLTGMFEAGAVLQATVRSHNPRYGLSVLDLDGGYITVPLVTAPVGASVRLRIRSRDVMLAKRKPVDISANTILRATISGLAGDGPTALVQMTVGTQRLVARITQLSAERMALSPGQTVYAIIKAVTVDR